MAYDSVSKKVLTDLSRMVGAMADASQREERILDQVVEGEKAYLKMAQTMLTDGESMPMGMESALNMLSDLGTNLEKVTDGLSKKQKGRAEELEQVKKKEEEEKEGGGGGDQDGGKDDKTGTDKTGDDGDKKDGDKTRVKDGDAEPIPEAFPPTTTGDPGTTTGTGDPGTTTGTGEPITSTPPTGTPPPPPREKAPPKKIPSTTDGDVVIKKKRKRRCFRFTLTNRTDKPVSDLHFDGKDLSLQSAGTGKERTDMAGWQAYNIPGGDGFWFGRKQGQPPIPPGGVTGKFEFCTDSAPRGYDIKLSHPDRSTTPIGPGGIRVGGRPARQNQQGQTILPTESVKTLYDIEVKADEVAHQMDIKVVGGKLSQQDIVVPDGYEAWVTHNGTRLHAKPIGRPFRAGETIPITVVSDSATTVLRPL